MYGGKLQDRAEHLLDSRRILGIHLMVSLTSIHLLVGIILGLFFRVWIIVPVATAVLAESILILINWSVPIWSGLIWSFGLLAALELGYVLGSAVRLIVARSRFRWKRQREDMGGRC